MRAYALFVLASLTIICGTSDAGAHGTAWKPLKDADLKAVSFKYSDGEPMAYAEVLVFSPQDPKVEHQNGRTDRHGKFAFCPDMPGTWRISASDGMGHLCQALVKIGPEAAYETIDDPEGHTTGGPSIQGSNLLKMMAGLSIIVNLAFVVQFFHRRGKVSRERA